MGSINMEHWTEEEIKFQREAVRAQHDAFYCLDSMCPFCNQEKREHKMKDVTPRKLKLNNNNGE